MSGPSLRCALRIAKRDAIRHRGRSILIIAMVAIPIAGMSAADVLWRTAQLSPNERASREVGQAQFVAAVVSASRITQDSRGVQFSEPPQGTRESTLTVGELQALLPHGTRVLEWGAGLRTAGFTADGRSIVGNLRNDNYTAPLATGIYEQRSGRAPVRLGEIAVTQGLSSGLGIGVGDTVTMRTGHTTVRDRVVGTIIEPSNADADDALAAATPPAPSALARNYSTFVTLPTGTDADSLRAALNRHGVLFTPRATFGRPAPTSALTRAYRAGVTLLVIGLATVETMLLAGAAFAIGARRQQRELALIGATGASRPDIGAVVLSGGLVLGVVGGVVGSLAGIPIALALRGPIEAHSFGLFGPLDIRPLELLGIAVLGVVTGVLSALLPARRAARADLVDALNNRQGVTRSRRAVTVLGAVMFALGLALTLYGTHNGRPVLGPAQLSGTGQSNTLFGSPSADFNLVLAGAILVELGAIACIPALLEAAGRLGRFLPVPARLALRDVSRNRGRTAPAIAGIVAALSGTIAVSTYVVSFDHFSRSTFIPDARPGQVISPIQGPISHAQIAAASAALPVRRVVTIYSANVCHGRHCSDNVGLAVPPAHQCPVPNLASMSRGELRKVWDDPRCSMRGGQELVAIGGSGAVDVALGHHSAAAAAALARGEAVALAPKFVTHGRVTLLTPDGPNHVARTSIGVLTVPTAVSYSLPGVVLPPRLAHHLGLSPLKSLVVFDTTRTPTDDEMARARTAVGFGVVLERVDGFSPVRPLILDVLAVVVALISIGACAVATGLAAAESRTDLATLSAIGAAPSSRRLLIAAQAATIGVLGGGLGLVVGLVPAWALIDAQVIWHLVLPWRVFGLTIIGLPLITALVSAVVTPSRLPLRPRST